MNYKIVENDNAHYMDASERIEYGPFPTHAAAEAACRRIVDEFLMDSYKPGMSAAALYDTYTSWGPDPFIQPLNPSLRRGSFSAWSYAHRRSREIANAGTITILVIVAGLVVGVWHHLEFGWLSWIGIGGVVLWLVRQKLYDALFGPKPPADAPGADAPPSSPSGTAGPDGKPPG